MVHLSMFFVGWSAWMLSTLAAGGAGVLFIPMATLIIPTNDIAPVVSIAGALAGLHRAWIYRKEINWQISHWLIPGTFLGAVFGVYIFSFFPATALRFCIGLFLCWSGISGLTKKDLHPASRMTHTHYFYFFPASFFSSAVSGVVGASGPMLNSLYLSSNVPKHQIIATKAVGILFMQVTKALSYASISTVSQEILWLGAIAGVGGMAGNYFGKRLLHRIPDRGFEKIISISLLLSGVHLLITGLLSSKSLPTQTPPARLSR
jgi:uncharacterized protein